MTKQELLNDIQSKVIVIISTDLQSDSIKEASGITSYISNVLIKEGDKYHAKNIGFYVVDEAGPSEEAFYRDYITGSSIDVMLKDFLKTLVPNTFLRAKIISTDEDLKFSEAEAYRLRQDDTVEKVKLFIYNQGQNIIYKELV